MAATKTDNDYLADKVALRLRYAPWPVDGAPLRLLDAFGGFGVCWRIVQRLARRTIDRAWIDNRHDVVDFHLHGRNEQILPMLFLDDYDCIDLDAYGVPYAQIRMIAQRGWRGIVFATFIQSSYGRLPVSMLMDLGFNRAMCTKAPTLITRHGWTLFARWLALMRVREIVYRRTSRKRYCAFGLNGAELRATDWNSQPADTAAGPA